MLLIGTAGFSYDDWHGPFYPSDLRPRDRLTYYARHFPMVEVDYTYYRMPTTRTMAGMEGKTPEGFRFCIKAFRGMTHDLPEDNAQLIQLFRDYVDALAPVTEAGKLGCVLAQFPWQFRNEPGNRDYLCRFRAETKLPLVIEFRNSSWVCPATFDLLRREGMGYCCVDEPRLRGLMPRIAVVTADIAYVRFHGRNAARWWKHEQAWERYDYLYTDDELKAWLPKIQQLAGTAATTYAVFNNCHAGQAAHNAGDLQRLVGEEAAGE